MKSNVFLKISVVIFSFIMKHTPAFLFGLALMGLGVAAQGQTAPAAEPVKSQPQPKGPAAPKRPTVAAPIIKDTAAFNRKFRRSGRPADNVPVFPRRDK